MTEKSPLFPTVVIIGPGLIGGSLGMALKKHRLAGRIVGVGRRQSSVQRAVELGAADEAALSPFPAVEQAELVVLATSVGLLGKHVAEILPRMKAGAILTDVGSVKSPVCAAAISASRNGAGALFVGGHPIAGSERRGVESADASLFEGALCVLTAAHEADNQEHGLRSVRGMWEKVGARVVCMSAEQHDEYLAAASHLPHAVAACLVRAISDNAMGFTGKGFLDATRIASGDPELWTDIFLANRASVGSAIAGIRDELQKFQEAVESGDADAVRRLLTEARDRRDARIHGVS